MTPGKATIYRPPAETDRDAIHALLTLSFTPTYARYAKLSFASLEHALVAVEEPRVVGVINWRLFQTPAETIGYVFWLAVHPDFRRHGIGETLFRRTLEIFDGQKLPVILTSVEKENLPSRLLMAKLGFSRISKAIIRRRLGRDGPKLYREMWVMPWEDLFVIFRS